VPPGLLALDPGADGVAHPAHGVQKGAEFVSPAGGDGRVKPTGGDAGRGARRGRDRADHAPDQERRNQGAEQEGGHRPHRRPLAGGDHRRAGLLPLPESVAGDEVDERVEPFLGRRGQGGKAVPIRGVLVVGGAGGSDPGQRGGVGVGDGAGHGVGGRAIRDDPQVLSHEIDEAGDAVLLHPARVRGGSETPPGEGGVHGREARGGGACVGRGYQRLVEDGRDRRAGAPTLCAANTPRPTVIAARSRKPEKMRRRREKPALLPPGVPHPLRICSPLLANPFSTRGV
jgi:hypothetical protein